MNRCGFTDDSHTLSHWHSRPLIDQITMTVCPVHTETFWLTGNRFFPVTFRERYLSVLHIDNGSYQHNLLQWCWKACSTRDSELVNSYYILCSWFSVQFYRFSYSLSGTNWLLYITVLCETMAPRTALSLITVSMFSSFYIVSNKYSQAMFIT